MSLQKSNPCLTIDKPHKCTNALNRNTCPSRVRFTDVGGSEYAEQANSDFTDENARNAPCGIVRHSTVWLKPVLFGQFEFTEWMPEGHLRHSRFVGLTEDKKAKDVVREMV